MVAAVRDVGYDVVVDKITLPIGGMTCASCVMHVENGLKSVPGVLNVAVNLATERATVEMIPGAVTLADLKHAVEDVATMCWTSAARRRSSLIANANCGSKNASASGAIWSPASFLPRHCSCLPCRAIFCMLALGAWTFCLGCLAGSISIGCCLRSHTGAILTSDAVTIAARTNRCARLAPNMDVLISVGTNAAYWFSVIVLVARLFGLNIASHVYFESAAVIITLIKVGNIWKRAPKDKRPKQSRT